MKLFKLFKREERAETQVIDENAIGADLLRALIGNEAIDKEKALEIPEVRACVNIIAAIVSTLPIKLYKNTDGEVEEILDDTRLTLLNNDTRDTLTAQQFWRSITEDYFVGKGAYAYINARDSLHYVDETAVAIHKNTDHIFKTYTLMVDSKTYYPHNFIKFLRNTKDGAESKSIVQENKLLVATMYATLKLEKILAQKGGKKSGFFESDKSLTKEAMDTLKTAYNQLYKSDEDTCLVLNNGVKFSATTNTAVELQLSERKKENTSKMAMIFNVPQNILNGNASSQDVENLIKFGITPVLNDFESSLDRDYLTEKEKENGYYYAFDTTEISRGTIKERFEAYGIAIDKNFMQIDEIRAKEDLEPLGFNYIKLGLDTVLFDPKTETIYTPNTGKKDNLQNTSINKEKGGED